MQIPFSFSRELEYGMFLGIHVDFRYFILSIVSAILFLQNYWCYLT